MATYDCKTIAYEEVRGGRTHVINRPAIYEVVKKVGGSYSRTRVDVAGRSIVYMPDSMKNEVENELVKAVTEGKMPPGYVTPILDAVEDVSAP